jgi:hypothetical protein
MFVSCADDFNIFGEKLRQPKCNVGFLSGLKVSKFINAFNYDDNL